MFSIQTKVLFAAVLFLSISACTNKDREMAQRQSDGTDTFKFQPPKKPATNAPLKPAPAVPGTKPRQDKKNDSDGTDTFKFKPDPRHFPKQKRESGT